MPLPPLLDLLPLAPANHGTALIILLAVLVADLVFGLLPGLARLAPDRAAVFSSLAALLERRLNRPGRPRRDLVMRGTLAILLLAVLAVAVGIALGALARGLPYGWIVDAVVLLFCVSGRRVFLNLRRGLRFAASDNLDEGRRLVSELTGRDASRLDNYGLARVIVEMGAVGFCRRVVTPVFWFVLLGLPGLLLSRVVSQSAVAVRHRDRDGQAFGAAALSLDHSFGVLPSWLGAHLLAIAAAALPRARVGGALRVLSIDAGRDAVINEGRVKGAVAGALGLALGGPFGTKGGGPNDGWIGNGRARVGQTDIRQTLFLCVVATLLVIMAVAALTLLRA